jgi:hypothetical protein
MAVMNAEQFAQYLAQDETLKREIEAARSQQTRPGLGVQVKPDGRQLFDM